MNKTVAEDGLRIGIDLGGTKIEGVLLAPKAGELVRYRVPTPRNDYSATIAAIVDVKQRLVRDIQTCDKIGVAVPGSVSPVTGVMRNANSTWLNGRTLEPDLAASLDMCVRLDNDANCFALSEATDGAGKDARVVFGVILGTGCGGGLVVNRVLLDGAHRIGGEWGHNPLPWARPDEYPGPKCWCGRRGCLETWVSGPGMAADHARRTGKKHTAKQIAARAMRGDDAANSTLSRYADRLARGLAHVINIVDPDVLVLGGGLSQLSYLYEQLPTFIEPYVFADQCSVSIKPPRWGDASGARGAARLWDIF